MRFEVVTVVVRGRCQLSSEWVRAEEEASWTRKERRKDSL